ncbi:MAG TPA: TIGR03435 family protein [Verrucomicrobiae bacterium]|nr:TIGR03435 family protein [Verrucomicrobiae bacterium]
MKRALASAGLMTVLVWASYAQENGSLPEFEAASVKPTTQPDPMAGMMSGGGIVRIQMGCSGGPGTGDPGRFTCTATNLHTLIARAWGMDSYQIAGPGTIDSERFDIAAKIPEGTTKEQFNLMLQKLLADRFHLAVHHEDREQAAYTLTVGKNGHKLETPKEGDTETAMEAMMKGRDGDGPAGQAMRTMMGGGGGSVSQGQVRQFSMQSGPGPGGRGRGGPIAVTMMNGSARMIGRRATMTDLTRQLSQQLGRPVLDQTGLTGEWNFSVEFSADSIGRGQMGSMMATMQAAAQAHAGGSGGAPGNAEPAEPSTAPTLPNALEKQLGLKLDARKAPADTIVVDKVEKVPTEN